MPLFGSRFSPKKTPLRRNQLNGNNKERLDELVSESGVIKLNLFDQDLTFENGHWIPGAKKGIFFNIFLISFQIIENGHNANIHKANMKLKQQIHDLEEENNMLKLKYEVLLDMVNFL